MVYTTAFLPYRYACFPRGKRVPPERIADSKLHLEFDCDLVSSSYDIAFERPQYPTIRKGIGK